MKAKNDRRWGLRYYRSKNPYGPETVSTLSCQKSIEVVSGITSTLGDHRMPNSHTYEVHAVEQLAGRISFVNATNAGYYGSYEGPLYYSDYSYDCFPLETFPSNTYNEALSRVYQELRGSIDLSIDILQAGQTARMFKSIAQVETYTSSFRSLKALIRGVSAARLTYVYGIRPMLSTIYESIEKLTDTLDMDLLCVRGRSRSDVSYAREFNLPSYVTSYQDTLAVREYQSQAHKCEIKLVYKCPRLSAATWTSLNPASIAWELTPYSFVVDWFLDVGSYLRNLETALLYRNEFKYGYVTRLSYLEGTVRNKKNSYYVGSGTGLNSCTQSWSAAGRKVRFARSRLTSSPTPEMPSFQADLGSARLLNAAALLGVLLRR